MYNIIKISFILVIVSLATSDALPYYCDQDVNYSKICSTLLNSNETLFDSTREELDKRCLKVEELDDCITCMEKQDQLLYRKVYSSMINLFYDICTPGKYQDDYFKHASCLNKATSDYEACDKNYEMSRTTLSHHQPGDHYQTGQTAIATSQEDIKRADCCSFHEYLSCYKQTALRSCGEETAVFISSLLKRMSSTSLKYLCLGYTELECGSSGKGTHISDDILLISIASLASFANIIFYAFYNFMST